MSWPFGALKTFGYDLIMADPPWPYKLRSERGEAKSYAAHYGAMEIEQIAAMRVGELARMPAVCFLWGIWPMLDAGFVVMKAWGFRFVTGGAWHKRTRHGKTAFGTGYRARSSCEPFLIGVLGNPDTSRAERNLIEGLAREHSRKPEEAYAWCERYLPGAYRCELFSRQSRDGWSTWGYEAGKFDPVVSIFSPSKAGEKIDMEAA